MGAGFLLKTTKKFIQNHGELIFECCMHFSWDKHKQRANTLVKKHSDEYYCECCNCSVNEKEYKQISELVEYINSGGRDDKKLKKLYHGVEAYECAVAGPGRIIENGVLLELSSKSLEQSFGLKKLK